MLLLASRASLSPAAQSRGKPSFAKMLLHTEDADHQLLHHQAAHALLVILLVFRGQFRNGAKWRFTLIVAPSQKNARARE